MKRCWKYSLIWLACGIFLYYRIGFFFQTDIPSVPASQSILDSDGHHIGQTVANATYRSIYTKLSDTPAFITSTVVELEDRRFYFHTWVDLYALARAFWQNLTTNHVQGGSTIEAQLLRNRLWLNEKRTLSKKLKEFLLAKGLDFHYSKKHILELYLNSVNFWSLNYGFAQASQFYFDKDLNNLTKGEMLALISIMKNPNTYDPFKKPEALKKRYLMLLEVLEKRKIISEEDAILMREEKIEFGKHSQNTLPYVTDFLALRNMPNTSQLRTTIDSDLTKTIDSLAKASIRNLAWKNVSDYGILVVERKTMQLKVMIGGYDYYGKEGQVNATLALRQPWSSLKPHIYVLAFQNLKKTPSSTILDLPVAYRTKDGYSYQPKNYSLDFKGEITLADALSQSINIPAVKLLDWLGVNTYLSFLKKIGITSLNQDAEYYGLSLALGSGEVNLFELLQSFSIYAHDGNFCTIRVLQTDPMQCKRIVLKKYTDMVVSILSNRFVKLAGFPIESNLDFPDREVFVKTGTSRNFNDNWAVWYTKNYMVGVWVGNKDGSEMKGVSGASGAGDIFNKIVYALEPIPERQLPSTFQKESQPYLSITSPLNGSTFELNPSIPLANQEIKLAIQTNIPHTEVIWQLNGKTLSGGYLPISALQPSNKLSVSLTQSGHTLQQSSIKIFQSPTEALQK